MTKFNVGDRVVLVNLFKKNSRVKYLSDDSNTIGNRGVVTGLQSPPCDPYIVVWDNKSLNSYHEGNLEMEILENV